MMLADWIGRLRAAALVDRGPIVRAAQQAANNATALAGGRVQFVVRPTINGATVIALAADGQRELARRAITRATVPAVEQAKRELEMQIRSRLTP